MYVLSLFRRPLSYLLVLAAATATAAAQSQIADFTIDGIHRYSQQNNVPDVQTLLSAFPAQLRRNYVFMERSRTQRPASVAQPRLIMYSADARLLVAVGSHAQDDLREVVDLAELDPSTGFWKLRSLDFRDGAPKLSADDSRCQACHGSPAKPIWDRYGEWRGAFGEDFDALTQSQADVINWLHGNAQTTDRFHHLEFDDFPQRYRRAYSGGDRLFVPRWYGYINTVFGFDLATAVAEGAYTRVKAHPRYEYLKLGFLFLQNDCQSRSGAGSSEAYARFAQAMTDAGATRISERELFRVLGVDFDETFSLAELANDPDKDAFWSNGEGFVYELVSMLVLDEAAKQLTPLAELLRQTPDRGAFSVDEANLADALAYRMEVGFGLRGDARQRQRESEEFRLNSFRAGQGMFRPLGSSLCSALYAAPVDSGPANPPTDPPNPPAPPEDPTDPPTTPPANELTWDGTLASSGAYVYLPDLRDGFLSGSGSIDATLTAASGAEFDLYLISIDRYQVVAIAEGGGSTTSIQYQGDPGRYAWFVRATNGSGSFQIRATVR